MRKEEKYQVVEELTKRLSDANSFYVADTSELTVEQVNALRRLCFSKGVEMQVAKNTLIKKALESAEKANEELVKVLVGPSALFFSDVANAPAKLIKEFRKTNEKPILKAALIETDVFVGDNQVDALAALKSKEELIGEVISLLESPAKNVISALKSGGNTIAGLVKTLEERAA